MNTELVPFISYGAFLFGTRIQDYRRNFELSFHPKDDDSGLESFSIEDPETSIFVENGIIYSIACYEKCTYMGRNIIGMSIDEFVSLMGEEYQGDIDEYNFELDDVSQFVYEFENIGLEVWVKNDVIVTVIAAPRSHYE